MPITLCVGQWHNSLLKIFTLFCFYFPGDSDGKASDYSAGDLGSIPWMEEPGSLQFMGSQRVGLSNFTSLCFYMLDTMHTHTHTQMQVD